jgi:hypothetical protein
VFVATSINLERIMTTPGLPGRAGESVFQLLQVFLISSVCLIPLESPKSLALQVLLIAVVSWVSQAVTQRKYYSTMTPEHPRIWITHRVAFSLLATIPFLIAGGLLLHGGPNALYWLVPGFLFSFVAAIFSAWVLLVEILR